jgi:hypothetical protein
MKNKYVYYIMETDIWQSNYSETLFGIYDDYDITFKEFNKLSEFYNKENINGDIIMYYTIINQKHESIKIMSKSGN